VEAPLTVVFFTGYNLQRSFASLGFLAQGFVFPKGVAIVEATVPAQGAEAEEGSWIPEEDVQRRRAKSLEEQKAQRT